MQSSLNSRLVLLYRSSTVSRLLIKRLVKQQSAWIWRRPFWDFIALMTRLTKIAQARKKIVQHLHRRGHVADFKVTPVLVMRWWNLLYNAIFDDKILPPKKILVKNFREVWGECHPYSKKGLVKLHINSEFLDRKQFVTILAHEMIHQWQWTNEECQGKMTHGESFKRWAPVLKKVLNLPLAESY